MNVLYTVGYITIYIIGIIITYIIAARKDIFGEFYEIIRGREDFPTKTVFFSIFWGITIIGCFFSFIGKRITEFGCNLFEKEKKRKMEERRKKISG